MQIRGTVTKELFFWSVSFTMEEYRLYGYKEQKQGREIMQNLNSTQYFRVEKEPELQVKDVLRVVFAAMKEKGYNPVSQIVGYIMSGDPTYITSHNNARSLIMKVERDEVVEEILRAYIKNEDWA